jgi:hypothetical protein
MVLSTYKFDAVPKFLENLSTPAFRTSIGSTLFYGCNIYKKIKIQGGSNMTGTNCDLFTHK